MKDVILDYIKKEYIEYPEEIGYDTFLIQGGYIDSFAISSLLVFIEYMFNVRIPEEEVTPSNFDTVTKITELINKYKK